MYLSVIIPTRNRARELSVALESIVNQTMPQAQFEVLVIDNGSTDNTENIVRKFSTRIENLRYFYEEQPGLHVGRHCGLKNARTEILVYADDDIRAFPTWLQAIKDTFEQYSDAVLVGGKNLPDYEVEPPAWVLKLWSRSDIGKVLGWYSLLDLGDEFKEIPADYVYGCNFSIRKKTLLEVGGFHPDSMPKDLLIYRGDGESAVSEAINARNLTVMYNPDASVYHLVSKQRMTFEYLFQRAFAQGISRSYTDIRMHNGFDIPEELLENELKAKHVWLRSIKRMACDVLRNVFKKKDRELETANTFLMNGYEAGYKFHQQNAREKPEVLAWILRKDFYW